MIKYDKKFFITIIVVLLIVSIPIALIINCVYKMWYMEGFVDDDICTYTEGKMEQYDGGSEARAFFPEYSEIEDKENIYFCYRDNRTKTNFFRQYHSYFLLDVSCENDQYETVIAQLAGQPTEQSEVFSEDGFKLVWEEYTSENVCKAIFCNDGEKVIVVEITVAFVILTVWAIFEVFTHL